MSQHTKTPWRRDSDMVLAEHDGNTDHVADCPARKDSSRFANAAFIVTACNSHEALKEALRKIREALYEIDMTNFNHDEIYRLNEGSIDAWNIANDALALTEVKP